MRPRPEAVKRETLVDFWRRLTEGRGALGGAVRFHEPVEDLLDDWKERVRAELGGFLRNFEPDFDEFVNGVMRFRWYPWDDRQMLCAVRGQAASAFSRWLEGRGVPPDVARQAAATYLFDFELRERGA